MRKQIQALILFLFISTLGIGQTFNVVAEMTGVAPTSQELADLQLASDSAKLELPTNLQNKFKAYDFGFYSMTRFYEGGYDAVWEKVKTDVEAKPESDFYVIFGRESSDAGPNTKIRVELVLPRTSQFECLTEEKRNNIEKYVQAVANQNLSNSVYEAEVKALEMLRAYIYKIIQCECTGIRTSCDLSLDYKYIDPELMGLGFRKKEITIGETCSWTNGTQEIHDYFGKQVIIDGQPYCITEQISVGKSLIEASQQVLPDTTIATSVSGKVFILDNESFTNGEWDNAKSQAGQHDYVEYWVIVKDIKTNKYYLYSKFSLEAMDAVALRGGGGDGTRGITGIVPTWGDALKALGNAAVDATLQAVIFRIVDPNVKDWGDAWEKVSYFGAAWEGIASLIPWKDKLTGPQEFVVRAAASAFTVVLDNYTRNKASYTVNQALIDFGVGFGASAITQLVFHPKVTEVIGSGTTYAKILFVQGVSRIHRASSGFLLKITNSAMKTLISDGGKILKYFDKYESRELCEIFYRKIDPADFEKLKSTFKIPPGASKETTTSPNISFTNSYDGVLIKFFVNKGTIDKLVKDGISDGANYTKSKFPTLPIPANGYKWTKNNSRFKTEGTNTSGGPQVNIQLGEGKALEIFNSSILYFEKL